MDTYQFKFQNESAFKYIIAEFVCGILLCFLELWLLGNPNILMILVSLFGPVVIGFGVCFKRLGAKDTIAIDDQAFRSEYYGRINYEDIEGVPTYHLWLEAYSNIPSLRLKLTSGQTIAWSMGNSLRFFTDKQDETVLNNFITDLLQHLDDAKKPNRSNHTTNNPEPNNLGPNTSSSLSTSKQSGSIADAAAQIRDATQPSKKRKKRRKKMIYIMAIIVILTAISRACTIY